MHAKILLPLCALLLSPPPDEGQWLPTQVREMDWDALRARGMELSRDEFWHPQKGGVLSAAIHINGCTASFVSPEGLVVTNHHCGFGAVNALSSVDNNYLEKGFVAASREQELPAPGVTVYVLKKIEDVTDRFHEAQAKAGSDLERWQITRQLESEIVRQAEAREADTVCNVAEYLEGQQYHLIYRTRLTDVRLVYAPPRAIGEFGGEVDNWEWPRHTGDFTFFRAYAAPDGTPRGYSPENVPYRPRHYLRVSAEGVHEGDLAIIMGYPGSTQRYRSSAAVRDAQGYIYPKREEVLTRALAVLEAAGAGDPQRALRLASIVKSMANVQKNARGMVWGLKRNAVVERKLREEQEFTRWVAADPERSKKFGSVLDALLEHDHEVSSTLQKDFAIGFELGYVGRLAPLLGLMVDACEAAMGSSDGKIPPGLLQALASDRVTREMDVVQRPILEILFDEFRILQGDQRLAGTEVLGDGDGEADIAEVTDRMLQSPSVQDAEVRRQVFGGGLQAIEQSDDPMIVLARGLARERRDYRQRQRAREGRRLVVGQRWIEAQEAWRGKDFYPDANGTLRVSIATVKGYVPRDGVLYTPHTTVAGVLEKETGEEPFASPKRLLEVAPQRTESRYFDREIGDVPVCFLADGDTTGGNSGSPVINGKGELVGLNFDRVFENVSGDFGWNPERSRNISVDIRYVLWIMESVYPAPHLLKEMGH